MEQVENVNQEDLEKKREKLLYKEGAEEEAAKAKADVEAAEDAKLFL